MTSINTNIAAQTALRTLQSTNMQLDQTQGRISTGLKIAEAKDNAAYWSISTTLRSDNKALGTVKDALGLGAATIDTAYQGLNETLSVLDEIKTKLTAATQDGVDKVAIQSEITALKDQLRSIATSATFSGENWLSVDGSVAGYADKKVVASFTRTGATVSIGTIDVNIANFALIDARVGTDGVLEGRTAATSAATDLATAIGAANTTTATYAITFGTTARTLGKDDLITFNVAVDGTASRTVAIDQELVNSVLKVTDGQIRNVTDFQSVLTKAFEKAGVTVGTTVNTTSGVLTATAATSIDVTGEAAVGKGGVLGIDIAGKSRTQIETMINSVVTASNTLTTAASNLGAISKRIELQQSFVSNLMDTIDAGVSGLVDADMNEESTRLQALQVKQQLGVQALSIANQSAQNVLSLFR